jgi:transcription termination factor Rho
MLLQLVDDPPNGAGMGLIGATELLINRIHQTDTNEDFLETLEK